MDPRRAAGPSRDSESRPGHDPSRDRAHPDARTCRAERRAAADALSSSRVSPGGLPAGQGDGARPSSWECGEGTGERRGARALSGSSPFASEPEPPPSCDHGPSFHALPRLWQRLRRFGWMVGVVLGEQPAGQGDRVADQARRALQRQGQGERAPYALARARESKPYHDLWYLRFAPTRMRGLPSSVSRSMFWFAVCRAVP